MSASSSGSRLPRAIALPMRHEEAAVERARGAADLHHQRLAERFQRFAGRLGGDRVELGQHGLEAALHVDAVIAVADRLVERGQLVGVLAMTCSAAAAISDLKVRAVESHARSSLGRDGDALAGRVEIERVDQLQADLLAGGERLMRIGQGDKGWPR